MSGKTRVLLSGNIFEALHGNTRDHKVRVVTPDGETHDVMNAGTARKLEQQHGPVMVQATLLSRHADAANT